MRLGKSLEHSIALLRIRNGFSGCGAHYLFAADCLQQVIYNIDSKLGNV